MILKLENYFRLGIPVFFLFGDFFRNKIIKGDIILVALSAVYAILLYREIARSRKQGKTVGKSNIVWFYLIVFLSVLMTTMTLFPELGDKPIIKF